MTIELEVPMLDCRMEMQLNEQLELRILLEEITELICQREHCIFQGDPSQLMLVHRDGKQILSLDQKPVPAGIRNGGRMILI